MKGLKIVRVGSREGSRDDVSQLKDSLLFRIEQISDSVMSQRAKEAFRSWVEHRWSAGDELASLEFERLNAVLRALQSREEERLQQFEKQFAVTLERFLDIVGLGLSCRKIEGDEAIYDLELFIANPLSSRAPKIPPVMKNLAAEFI